jgi:hypothetical protein
MKKLLLYLSLILVDYTGAASAQTIQPASKTSPLFCWADKLQQNINPQNTAYRHKDDIVTWGDDGSPFQCYADCSGFINALICKATHWTDADLKAQLGHKRMYAYHYYAAIVAGNHFMQIKNIHDITPGDLIALLYPDRTEHDDNTGHMMVVASAPRSHQPSKILEPNTEQYEVEVIDCTKSPHGKNDTRITSSGNYGGLGKGTFRLYTDLQGNIVGYSWSPGNPKEGFDPYEKPVAVGRFME